MVWQIRRTNESDSSDEVQPVTHPTAAVAYDVAMDNAQTWMKNLFQADPLVAGMKLKLYRDTVGQKGLRIVLQTVNDAVVVWFIEEV